LSLDPGSFTLALRDSLGNPSIKLDSYDDFVKNVCQPLLQNPDNVKIDEKGRRVLVFIVEKKGSKQEEKRKISESIQPVTCSLPPPLARLGPSSSASSEESVIDYSPMSSGGKTGIDELSKRFEPLKPDSQKIKGSPSRRTLEKSGYNTAYATPRPRSAVVDEPSTSTDDTASVSSTSSASTEKEESVKPTVTESWGTVRGMLETFVKDLNVHLADTFGDEAGGFRLNAGEGSKSSKEEEVKEVQKEEEVKPVSPKVVHSHVFCDRCLYVSHPFPRLIENSADSMRSLVSNRKTISGNRYKCKGCSNYDLCE